MRLTSDHVLSLTSSISLRVRQHLRSPLYIWYDGYPPHVADSYRGRLSRVSVRSTEHGLASLNVSDVTEPDAGWYECIVHFLNQSPAVLGNATWVHLDVHGKD